MTAALFLVGLVVVHIAALIHPLKRKNGSAITSLFKFLRAEPRRAFSLRGRGYRSSGRLLWRARGLAGEPAGLGPRTGREVLVFHRKPTVQGGYLHSVRP